MAAVTVETESRPFFEHTPSSIERNSAKEGSLLEIVLPEFPGFAVDETVGEDYLDQLASYGISKLIHEPEHLKSQHEDLLEQTQSLAYENYRTFIQAAECSREIFKDFNIIEDHLVSLMESLPSFASRIEDFSSASQRINTSRKQNSLVLSRHTQVLEILEISQLMDTCVRNGYYEEALELANYVKRLEKKFASIKIITAIGDDVRRSSQLMLSQLLQQLRGNIQLPACLRIVSYLRQLDVFSEAELRLKFLQARDAWFQNILLQVPADDSYTHITKVIEASRVNLFDIVTHYRAIFSDDDPVFGLDEEKNFNFSNILHAWITRKISEFIKTLQQDLNKGLMSRLDSVFGQCMYFGLSFSRIGADFRGVLVPLFHRALLACTGEGLESATIRFEEDMKTFTLASVARKVRSSQSAYKGKSSPSDVYTPPHGLLDFPPLAVYTNRVLAVFNNVRQYPAVPLVYQVADQLQRSLSRVVVAIESWARLESQSHQDSMKQEVKNVCSIAGLDFLIYINRAFEAVYHPSVVSEMVGRLPMRKDLHVKSVAAKLDVEALVNVLKDFVDVNAVYLLTSAETAAHNVDVKNDTSVLPQLDEHKLESSLKLVALASGDVSKDNSAVELDGNLFQDDSEDSGIDSKLAN